MARPEVKQNLNIMNTLYSQVPSFSDIFDEQTWYIFVGLLTLSAVLIAMLLSRYVTIKPVEP